jgi:Rab-like protein 2
LTLYRYDTEVEDATAPGGKKKVAIDFWDTAGQERFASMHASYYYKAHACIMVFDVTRKVTYTNLQNWYQELRRYCATIPCFVVANKIDVDYSVTSKSFAFATKNNLPLHYVSAADGTNVVAVFKEAIGAAWSYKHGEKDFMAEVLELLGEDDDTAGAAASSKAGGAAGAGAAVSGK